jgi:ATP-dependent RNA helicase SUPV3L1/SUV3
LNEDYEVAVIDEIQMIGDGERGWAWTRALLAVRAKRIHLCGDERALNIISKLLELTGDILE